jgi:hypothetical protein
MTKDTSKPEGSLYVDRSCVRGSGEDCMVVACVLEWGVDKEDAVEDAVEDAGEDKDAVEDAEGDAEL